MILNGGNISKKMLLGSIISITILIGVSFTSVIGYRRVASDVKTSPLFNVRSTRAIQKDSDDFNCKYVGKREEITIPLPTRDNRTELIQKLIYKIRNMDDTKFDKFIHFLGNQLNQESNLNDGNIVKIYQIIDQLKNKNLNLKKLKLNQNIDIKNRVNISEFTMEETYCYGCGFTSEPLSCFIIMLLLMIFFPITIPLILPFFIAGIGILLLFILFFIFDMFLFTTIICEPVTFILC